MDSSGSGSAVVGDREIGGVRSLVARMGGRGLGCVWLALLMRAANVATSHHLRRCELNWGCAPRDSVTIATCTIESAGRLGQIRQLAQRGSEHVADSLFELQTGPLTDVSPQFGAAHDASHHWTFNAHEVATYVAGLSINDGESSEGMTVAVDGTEYVPSSLLLLRLLGGLSNAAGAGCGLRAELHARVPVGAALAWHCVSEGEAVVSLVGSGSVVGSVELNRGHLVDRRHADLASGKEVHVDC